MRTFLAPDFHALSGQLERELNTLRGIDSFVPITIVVPNDQLREGLRRQLAESGGTLGVAVESFGSWVRRTADQSPEGGERPHGAEAAWKLLADRTLERLFAEAPDSSLSELGTYEHLSLFLLKSLQDVAAGRVALDDLSNAGVGRLDDIRRDFLQAARAWFRVRERCGIRDRHHDEELAARCLASSDDSNPLWFFGFHDLTALQRQLISAAPDRVTMFVPGPGGACDVASASLVEWATSVGEIVDDSIPSPSCLTLREGLFEETRLEGGGLAVAVEAHASEEEEVRAVARRILNEVRAGRSYDDFLIVAGKEGPPIRAFRRVFARTKIPLVDRAGVRLRDTEIGRRLRILVHAIDPSAPEARDRLVYAAGPPARELLESLPRANRWTWRELCEELARAYEMLFEDVLDTAHVRALHGLRPVFREARHPIEELTKAASDLLEQTKIRDPFSSSSAVWLVRREGARGIRRNIVFHTGLVEGAIRRRPTEDVFLPDFLRERVNDRTEHQGRFLARHRTAREDMTLLARFAFETAQEKAILTYSTRTRLGGASQSPSRLVSELDALTPPLTEPFLDELDVEMHELETRRKESLERVLAGGRRPFLLPALTAAQARWSGGRVGPFDGQILGEEARRALWKRIDPARNAWSPTALESLVNCPFGFLVERVLKLRPVEDQQDDFDPAMRGLLFHEISEVIGAKLLKEGRFPLRAENISEAIGDLEALVSRYEADLANEGPRARSIRRATLASIRDDLVYGLAREAYDPKGRVPVRHEWKFGFSEDLFEPQPSFDLGQGLAVRLRGKIDRVDRNASGDQEVIDWKTGPRVLKDGEVRSWQDGRARAHLQLPLYLEVVRELSSGSAARASLVHATLGHGFEEVHFDLDDLERVRPAIRSLLRESFERAKAGHFPCRPGATACCRRALAGACGSGVAARSRLKREDPWLTDHERALARLGPSESDEATSAPEHSK